jgi:hypothetical protein
MALRFEHGFPNDLFLSVADGDRAADGGALDWCSRFADALTRRVEFLSRKTLRIRHDSHRYAGKAVQEQLQASALLVHVVSPSYVASDTCRDLCDVFLAAPAAAGVPPRNRMLRIDKAPLPDKSALRPEVADLARYKFYRNEPGHTYREFDLRAAEMSAEEAAVVDDFARQVIQHLTALESGAIDPLGPATRPPSPDPASPGMPPAPASGPLNVTTGPAASVSAPDVVHLALTTGDIDSQCGELRRWFEQTGYEILGGPVRARDAAAFRTGVAAALAGARLAVFPVGRLYGWQPADGDGKSFMALQLEEALNCPALERIVWIPKGLDKIEELQQRLIDDIRKSYPAHGFEVLEVPFQQLANHLKSRGRKTAAAAEEPPDEPSGDVRVYFMYDLCDHEAATPYRQFLIKKGIEVDWLSKKAADSGASLHRDWLVEDHGFVIYYANSDDGWYRRQQQELRKAKGYGRTSEVKSLTFLDPPESDDKKDLRLKPWRLLDGLPPKELEEKLKELDAFVEALKRNGGGGAPPA